MNTNAIRQQVASCRCENEKQAMQTRFENQQNHCATMQAIDKVGDRIVDYLTNQETQRLRDENQTLKFQASQPARGDVITTCQTVSNTCHTPKRASVTGVCISTSRFSPPVKLSNNKGPLY